MKTQNICLAAATLVPTFANAASITATIGNPAGGQGYAYNVSLNASDNDTTSFRGTVGSWSWEDESLPGAGNFWRHQSDWLAITLTEDSTLRIEVERDDAVADIKLFPSFTIYRNFNDTMNGAHFSSNTTDIQWEATSQLLEYVDHHANNTAPGVDESFALPAGDYTILLGGNAESQILAENVNYAATLTASPIPEPASAALSIIGAILIGGRRRR